MTACGMGWGDRPASTSQPLRMASVLPAPPPLPPPSAEAHVAAAQRPPRSRPSSGGGRGQGAVAASHARKSTPSAGRVRCHACSVPPMRKSGLPPPPRPPSPGGQKRAQCVAE